MTFRDSFFLLLPGLFLCLHSGFAETPPVFTVREKQYSAPPTPPPDEPPSAKGRVEFAPLALTGNEIQYSIGDPSDEEQLFVELINRSRADANAEAQRFVAIFNTMSDPDIVGSLNSFAVDRDLMVTQFSTLEQSIQPLSINEKITNAARSHTLDMFDNTFQGHTGTDGSTLGTRLDAAAYTPRSGSAENVFSFADSVEQGHAGFDIDWGTSSSGQSVGGMQSPPGHRNNIHNGSHREIGVGVIAGKKTGIDPFSGQQKTVGPILVTQEFSSLLNPTPFITGVAYYDLNENNFYDLGEGLGGITVEVVGAEHFAITAQSGGYSVPVSGNGSFTVIFSGPGMDDTTTSPTVENNLNEKQDLILSYSPPLITPPTDIFTGTNNTFSFTPVGGATGYRLREGEINSAGWTEGAENGAGAVMITSSPGYDVIQSESVSSGSFAFHLAQVNFEDQYVVLDRLIRPSSGSSLQFSSRLFFAAGGQTARVQVSTDSGITWEDVFTQAGDSVNTPQESAFSQKSVALSDFAEKEISIRFCYDFSGGSAFTQTDLGWYFDEITVTNASQVENITESELGETTSFTFNPPAPGEFLLQVAPVNIERVFPFGPAIIGEAVAGGGQTDVFDGVALGDNFFFSPWYGIYNTTFFPWVFHIEHGWQFVFTTATPGQVFLFDLESKDFWWTTSAFTDSFFTFFSFNRGTFNFYFDGTANPRSFVDLETEVFWTIP